MMMTMILLFYHELNTEKNIRLIRAFSRNGILHAENCVATS